MRKLIYDFKRLKQFMDNRNYPDAKGSAIEIKRVDLTENESNGKIEFRTDGIYFLNNNLWQKGYMYIKTADVAKYDLPKMHVANCKVINGYRDEGKFDGHFFWSNEGCVDVKQRGGTKVYKSVNLILCKYCKKEVIGDLKYNDTLEFHNHLEIKKAEIPVEKKLLLDINGYTHDWKRLSRKFREQNNYICNVCKLDLSGDSFFLEVHHKDGVKINNSEQNLECKCLYCHVNTDDLHLSNCKKNAARVKAYNRFIDRFEAHLTNFHNRRIDRL